MVKIETNEFTVVWRDQLQSLNFAYKQLTSSTVGRTIGRATIENTDITIIHIISKRGSEFWAEVEGPECLDPMMGQWFGFTTQEHKTVQGAIDEVQETINSVIGWAKKNS